MAIKINLYQAEITSEMTVMNWMKISENKRKKHLITKIKEHSGDTLQKSVKTEAVDDL